MAGKSLRDRQIASIKQMLALNDPALVREDDYNHHDAIHAASGVATGADGELKFRILIFDDFGRDVISSVLKVSDLRAMGITMHMHLSAQRYPIPDVDALYLVAPNQENLQAITADLRSGLYSPAHLNFLWGISRPLLEEFAAETATAGTSEHIASLYDQYLNFVVAGAPDLFSLNMQKEHTYKVLNSAKTSDELLDHIVDRMVSGLMSVVVTMGVTPIIRCPKGGAAEMLCMKLDRKLRDHLVNSSSNKGRPVTSAGAAASRPVLIILDRNIDLTVMVSHSWTYRSLIHDVMTLKLNSVTVETPRDDSDPSKGSTKKTYTLNADDEFWSKNAALPFPEVAENIDADLLKYKEDAAEITKQTGVNSIEDLQNETSASTQRLKAAITLLPELKERKALLDMHMNILASLLGGIKDRQLNDYFQLEENITKQTKAQILDLIKESKGTQPTDKLRIFIIWALSAEQDPTRAEWTQFEEALAAAGADATSLAYIRQLRQTTRMTQLTTAPSAPQAASASSDLFGRFSAVSSRLTERLKDSGVSSNLSANLESIMGGIKTFLPANRDLTITKIVESIVDPAAAASSAIAKTENYLYFDPRQSHGRSMGARNAAGGGGTTPGGYPGGSDSSGAAVSFGQRRQGFSEAIVFMVGGGSYDEYGNLQEWVTRTSNERTKRSVVYGSTEILSSDQFIKDELEPLGSEI